jgi:glutamate dehydrogenase
MGVVAVDAAVFVNRYLAHAASDLPGQDEQQLRRVAEQALQFGMQREPDQTLLAVVQLDGRTTAVEIVMSDVSYLVDSVREELNRIGRPSARVLHPQLVVTRAADGTLESVHDVDDTAKLPAGAVVESWMHIEIDLLPDQRLAALEAELRGILADVQFAAADRAAMSERLIELAHLLRENPGEFDRETSAEAGELLAWLADDNYLVLGHTAYSVQDLANPLGTAPKAEVEGVLRGEASISPIELMPAFRSGVPLVIFKSPLTSRVKRRSRYDCVTVVTPASGGRPQTVHVFLGLIADEEQSAVMRVPMVRKRLDEIRIRAGVRADSHSGRQLLSALRTLPRDELLEAPTADLLKLAQLVVARADHRAVGVFARLHLNRDFVTVLVYFPADRFGPDTRRRVEAVISRHWPGDVIDRDDRIVELGFARMKRLIALRPGMTPPQPERAPIEAEVAIATRGWSEQLFDLLHARCDTALAERLQATFRGTIPEAYKEDFTASEAVDDLLVLADLAARDGLAFRLYKPDSVDPDHADHRLKVFRTGDAVSLARTLPIFTLMGVEVVDERPYAFEPVATASATTTDPICWIYDFGLRLPAGVELDEQRTATFIEAVEVIWRGGVERDSSNALVVRAGLSWWQVNILRAYSRYLRQSGTPYSRSYLERALVDHSDLAERLVALFEARFDPDRGEQDTTAIVDEIERGLTNVTSLDQDAILRGFLGLVQATLRTNAYQHDADGKRRTALAFKFDPKAIRGLPEPRPKFEIWVYSPRVEGVHLRFGAVARGGLRWSDRPEDFRTEILGLVKAQMVKNAVIVPTGSKGGFVPKQLPDPAVDREAWMTEGVACYRTFIACLLDVTDNYVVDADGDERVVSPDRMRRYDGDDPYLVVAADKGTASFSDIANEIALDYGYWLGDAFASGGSQGYDHKAMGITARGAWESVKYHFRERGVDVQSQPITVVGIGDMSGDVFGNAMLRSEHIKLVAAFDHRHVFIDPAPDAAATFAERRRLFTLPRSSWDDFDRSIMSRGGGVFPRSLKSVALTPEMRQLLDVASDVVTLSPTELIRAVLRAPVDLIFNGGIGTYVKSSIEPQSAAGDKANDGLRVDGVELRAHVVAEGGNLGFTQLGRVEIAREGGRINTDAIDNSAGVDTSDHEVNLKILLNRAVTSGRITQDERNALLESVTEDVAALVLRDNYEQNVLLGMARTLSPALLTVHQRFIQTLVTSGQLDRELEFLPSDKQLEQRAAEGIGLLSPENAVLAAYAKLSLTHHIEDSSLPDEPWFQQVLAEYFPVSIAERFRDELVHHPLRREIITTSLVNEMVNRGGTTFVFRAAEETGADPAEVARAYTVVREVFDLPQLWREIESLDNVAPTVAQHAAYAEVRRLIDRATRWFLDARFPINDVAAEVERFAATMRELGPRISELVRGAELDDIRHEAQRLSRLGLSVEIATKVAELLSAFLLLDVVEIASASDHSAAEIAELHFALSDEFFVDEMLVAITGLPRDDRWSALARAAVRHDVYAALSAITQTVLRSTPDTLTPDERVATWTKDNAERVERARGTVRSALDRDHVDLATLSVALRIMRTLPSGG